MDPYRAPQCIDVEAGDLLIGYASDTLGAEQRKVFEAHRAACLACEEQLVPMRRLLGALAMLPASPVAEHAKLLGAGAVRSQRAAIAAVVLLALACAWMLGAGPKPIADHELAGEIGALQARIARLELQNEQILRTVERAASPEGSVQPIYGRMPIPPNL